MKGPTPIDPELLEIGDTLKVELEGSDEVFKGKLISASLEEGLVFENETGQSYFMDLADVHEFTFIPTGDTIKHAIERRAQAEFGWKQEAFEEKQCLLEESKAEEEKIIVTDEEVQFFELFNEYKNTSLGDQHKAEILEERMRAIVDSSENIDLQQAFEYVIKERQTFLEEAAAI